MEEILRMITAIFPSIFFFIGTRIYLRKNTQITTLIYKQIMWLLFIAGIILFIMFAIFESIFITFAYLIYIPIIYAMVSLIGTSYILKRYFQCKAWLAHILFGLLTLSLYYISFIWLMLLACILNPLNLL